MDLENPGFRFNRFRSAKQLFELGFEFASAAKAKSCCQFNLDSNVPIKTNKERKMFIGDKIRELRQTKNMKLVDLASKSGVQIATLSRIEHNKMTGTLDSHMNIAKALEVDITSLYSNIVSPEELAEAKTPKSITGTYAHNNKSSYEILTSKVLTKRMMPMLLKIEAGGKTNKEQNRIGSEKFVFVLEGKIEVHVAGDTYKLEKNNTLYFDASLEHWIVNTGAKTAKVLIVGTPVAL